MDREFDEALARQNMMLIKSKAKKLWDAMQHVPRQVAVPIPYIEMTIEGFQITIATQKEHQSYANKAVTP